MVQKQSVLSKWLRKELTAQLKSLIITCSLCILHLDKIFTSTIYRLFFMYPALHYALYMNCLIKLSQKSYEGITALIPILLMRNWIMKSEICHPRSIATVSAEPWLKPGTPMWKLMHLFKLLDGCYGLNCLPPNSHVETLNHNVTIFGNRADKEVFKVKWGRRVEP